METTAVEPADADVPQEHAEGPRRSYVDASGRVDVSVLEDRMPPTLKAPRAVAGLTLALGLFYLVLSYGTIWHTDIWGHLDYGRWIATNGQVPITEPLMPLARGVPFIDTAWLSQVIEYALWTEFGLPALQFLYAASITFVAALLAATIYRRTGNALAGLFAVVVFYVVNYQQLLIVRPQLAGLICFTLTFCLASSFAWKRWYWFAIPALFAVWANLHGSFVVGLVTLGALSVGRAVDVAWRRKSLRMLFCDTQSRNLLLVTELSAAAALLNPYGIGIYGAVLEVAENPNLNDLVEWMPMTLRMSQGKAMAAAALLLIGLHRFSPRRVRIGEVLVIVGLGCSALWTSRMILWWAPAAAYYIGLHGASVWNRIRPRPCAEPRRSGLWTVVSVGLAWIFFAYTPFGVKLIHGKPDTKDAIARQFRKSVSPRTPVGATAYLREHPPQGQVFNTFEWGDYLLWAGPKDVQVFVASHAHLVPREVWQDYMQIAHAAGNWQDKLDRYGVNTVVLDRNSQPLLTHELKQDQRWEKKYEDGIGAIFVRRRPI